MSPHRKFIITIAFIFFATSILFLILKKTFVQWDIDTTVLMAANILLFIISIATSMLQRKALNNSNPNVFMRSVMLGMMIKMFVCAGAVIVYVLMDPNSFNGTAIFIFMLLYVVYLVAEVGAIMKLNKRTNA